jgi:hypothetical protein
MANSAELMQVTTTCDVCRNILSHIQNKCNTLEDAEKYVGRMLANAERVGQRKGMVLSPPEENDDK